MLNNKNYRIFYFYIIRSKPDKSFSEIHVRARAHTDFKLKLINRFSREKMDNLVKYSFLYIDGTNQPLIYKDKPWLTDPFEIGLDMIEVDYGVIHEHKDRGQVYAVPLQHTDIIKFFEENIPEWVEIRKRM
jgi:hypothetical protein